MKSGFTLVEISIVMMIIALMIGGIIGGRSMIKSSELRTIINDRNIINQKILMFKDKYRALPGDMENSYVILGDGCGSSPSQCDGDGDDQINKDLVWNQLRAANLYDAKIWQTYLARTSLADTSAYSVFYGNTNKNVLRISSFEPGLPGIGRRRYINGADSYWIDNKIDDGEMRQGNVIGSVGVSGNRGQCQVGYATTPTTQYNKKGEEPSCYLDFTLAY